jgi:hypothetical protein
MRLELKIEDQVIVKAEIDISALLPLLQTTTHSSGAAPSAVTQSIVMTVEQVTDLLSRVDPKSAEFLKKIGENNGTISWGDTRAIFGIEAAGDWSAFASSYGRGITRAVRYVTGIKSARLVWWNNPDWDEENPDPFTLHVDGPALQALRLAVGP